jgi:hypothetical protein
MDPHDIKQMFVKGVAAGDASSVVDKAQQEEVMEL